MKNGKTLPYRLGGLLTISRNLERQIREHLVVDIADVIDFTDPENAHAQKAKYLLDRLDEAREGKR